MRNVLRRRRLNASLLLGLVSAATAAAGIAAPAPATLQLYVPPDASTTPNAGTAPQPTIYKGAPGARNAHVRPQSSRNRFVPEPDITGTATYIVRLHDLPVATYDGRVDGLAATKGKLNHTPGKHGKANNNHGAEVSAYRQYLHDQQKAVMKLAQGKGIKNAIRHQFTDSLNAFTIDLTQQQAAALATLPQVDYVQRAGLREMLTDRGPQFIGADQVWTGNTFPGGDYMGEGIIVGELDSGINTDNHPSFVATGGDGYTVTNPLGTYLGDCVATPSLCNDKLIGVWSWPVITDTYAGIRPPNGKDYAGHGSHTASTAAGNIVMNVPYMGPSPGNGIGHGVPTTNPSNPAGNFSFTQVSGVAPHANIIAYQVCYPTNGCPDEAILLATEQAINDGVDVINFSIGGSERFPWNDPIALAFLSARDAGIAVAAAAGNAGPNFFTLDHSAPWYIQVAAESHDRVLGTSNASKGGITLGGTALSMPSFSATTPTGGISPSSDPSLTYNLVVPAAPLDPYCNTAFPAGTFQPTDIVVCKRGTITRVGKAFNVQAGGAGAIVVTNNGSFPPAGTPTDADDLSTDDVYPLPGIQLKSSQGNSLITWITTKAGTHTATLTPNTITRTITPSSGNQLAPFSSRGPSSTYFGSVSPNVTAPGVRIFAAYSDEHPFDDPKLAASRDWAVLDGTSMATPHVTGAMALVRQAHPDWTPAEVQSALEMTAKDIVKYNNSGQSSPLLPAGIYRAGAGQVDPQAAINAGLVMDETADDFAIANPDNGGDVLQLNLPHLVNNFCQGVCSWVREVRATRDGTWTASNNTPWVYERSDQTLWTENRVKMSVSPSTFTLKTGQTQTLLIQADMTDVVYQQNGDGTRNTEQVELWSKLTLTSSDATVPVATWPISMNYDHGMLPRYLSLAAHRDLGGYRVPNVQLPAMSSVTYRSHGLTKANVETVTLSQDSNHQPWYTSGLAADAASTTVRWITVPAGSSRLVTEVLQRVSSTADSILGDKGHLKIWIGLDADNNGQPDYTNETLCSSTTEEELNYCSIDNPDPGTYWVIFQDARGGISDNNGNNPSEVFQFATAVVPAGDAGNLAINGPASTTGSPMNLDVNWNLSQLNLKTGDVAYGGFDVGAANAPGNVGFVPVKITRAIDDVTMTTSQTAAKVGDVIDVNVHVAENDSGSDRTFNLQSILPSGLTVVPGSVTVSTAAQRGNLNVNGNTVTIAGTQVDSENWPHTYNVTTSDTDPLCRTTIYSANGFATTGGHVGLLKHLGINPTFGGLADSKGTQAQTIDLGNFWDGGWSLYNNNAWFAYTKLSMSPQGWVITDPGFGDVMYSQQKVPYAPAPYTTIIAPLWKGVIGYSAFGSTLTADTLNTPLKINSLDLTQTTGMGVAYATTGDLIMEWNGAKTYHLDNTVSPATTTIKDDSYDIDLIINKDVRYADGQYELIMTYDNINFGTQGGLGSIGLSGYTGPLDSFGPFYGYLGVQYAWNDLQSKLHNNLVVCYDYQGPESTQYDVAMKVRVAETAVGTTQLLRWTSHVDGMPDHNVDATIAVSGTIKLSAIAAQQTPYQTTLTGVPVVYVDSDGTPDTISVTGPHVTAVVNGNAPGATFDLIPDPGFSGTTQVTVTVSDQNNPSDHVSTMFTLTVGGEPSIFKSGFDQ